MNKDSCRLYVKQGQVTFDGVEDCQFEDVVLVGENVDTTKSILEAYSNRLGQVNRVGVDYNHYSNIGDLVSSIGAARTLGVYGGTIGAYNNDLGLYEELEELFFEDVVFYEFPSGLADLGSLKKVLFKIEGGCVSDGVLDLSMFKYLKVMQVQLNGYSGDLRVLLPDALESFWLEGGYAASTQADLSAVTISNSGELHYLYLLNLGLNEFPKGLENSSVSELFSLAENDFTSIPDEVWNMDTEGVISFAGNPITGAHEPFLYSGNAEVWVDGDQGHEVVDKNYVGIGFLFCICGLLAFLGAVMFRRQLRREVN